MGLKLRADSYRFAALASLHRTACFWRCQSGTDETTYTVTKALNGLVFLLDAGGFPPGTGHSLARG